MSRVLHKFNLLDFLIARKFPTHDHPLYSTTEHGQCAGCFGDKELSAEFYECPRCDILFHKKCIGSAAKINHPIHPQHSLWLLSRENLPNNSNKTCSLCGKELMLLVYYCLICDFKLDMSCVHFTSEHHLMFHKEGKIDDMNRKYDAGSFKQILQFHSKPTEPDHLFECLPSNLRPSSNGNGAKNKSHDPHYKSLENAIFTAPTIIPPMVLPLLHKLAQQMVKVGHQQQLFKTYRDTRAAVLEQSFQKLGVERISKDDVHRMKWEVLEAKAVNWIHCMRISVKLLFAAEKKICDQILDGVESLRDQCFGEVTSNSVAVLLSFGEAIAKSKRSPEKLFPLLDMYNIMRELQTEFELIFRSKPCTEMKESALFLTKRLAQTAQKTLVDFEEAVAKDASKTAVIDGSYHPLTNYVVNYIKYLFDYQSTLRLVYQELDKMDPDFELRFMTTRILQALQNNLDGKSKQYKDAALAQLFLMNNVYYIVRSVRRSKEQNILDHDWVQTHRRIVQKHANQYKRISWTKISLCLNVRSSGSGSIENSSILRALYKDKFKTFNSQFEELHQRQCQWIVPDSELRESLRLSVSEVLLPAFKSFLKRFGPIVESSKNSQKYIRFTPEDIERMLSEFFEGKSEPKNKNV